MNTDYNISPLFEDESSQTDDSPQTTHSFNQPKGTEGPADAPPPDSQLHVNALDAKPLTGANLASHIAENPPKEKEKPNSEEPKRKRGRPPKNPIPDSAPF